MVKKGSTIPWNKGKKYPPELCRRISEAKLRYYETHDSHLKGKKIPEEIVQKQRQARLKYYQTHEVNNKGKKHSKTTRRKISQSCKKAGVGKWNRRKKKDKE